jgi:hypothetical protein
MLFPQLPQLPSIQETSHAGLVPGHLTAPPTPITPPPHPPYSSRKHPRLGETCIQGKFRLISSGVWHGSNPYSGVVIGPEKTVVEIMSSGQYEADSTDYYAAAEGADILGNGALMKVRHHPCEFRSPDQA